MSRKLIAKCSMCEANVDEDLAYFCHICGEGPLCYECSKDHEKEEELKRKNR